MSTEEQTNTNVPKKSEAELLNENLTSFKEYMHTEFREECEKRFGITVFAEFIYPYYSDMLECIEYHIEDLHEQTTQEKEYL